MSVDKWTQDVAKHDGKSQFESVTLASEVLSNLPTASFFDRRAVTMNQLFCNIDIILSNVSSKTI